MSNIFDAGRARAQRRKDFLQQTEFASALQQVLFLLLILILPEVFSKQVEQKRHVVKNSQLKRKRQAKRQDIVVSLKTLNKGALQQEVVGQAKKLVRRQVM